MHFHFPRRHRRRLLFPPGLLALSCLLWLGCVALRAHEPRLKQKYVLDLTMPPKVANDLIFPLEYNTSRDIKTYAELDSLYSWRDVALNGNKSHDSLVVSSVAKSMASLRNDTISNCGVRVYFSTHTKYESVVSLLNLMDITQQKKYLLDPYHGLFKLYILVDDYKPKIAEQMPESPPAFICGTRDSEMMFVALPPPVPSWTEFRQLRWLALLKKPEWRASLALLGVLAFLGGWRVVRAWRVA